MLKRTKIIIRYVWGWGVFCDQCGAQLTRHRPKRKVENLRVNPDAPAFCTKCERSQAKALNKSARDSKKAQKQAQARAERNREQSRERMKRKRERDKMLR